MSYYRAHISNTVKTMASKFPGKCCKCNQRVSVGDMIIFRAYPSGQKTVEHETVNGCAAATKSSVTADQATAARPKIDLTTIVDFIKAAQQRGLKRPKLRVLDVDGRSELRLSLTTVGIAPGSVAVVKNHEYEGGVRPDGTIVGKLTSNTARQQLLLTVAADPDAAAKSYAAVMSQCCYCGKPLTDAGSVECGYGPICAKHWGRPHSALGTTTISAAPGQQQPLPLEKHLDPQTRAYMRTGYKMLGDGR